MTIELFYSMERISDGLAQVLSQAFLQLPDSCNKLGHPPLNQLS